MFEKEAEEYRKDLKSKFFLSEPQLDLACQGFKDGYNKANKWHEVEKGDLPKNSELSVIGILKGGKFAISHTLVECHYSKLSGWSDC